LAPIGEIAALTTAACWAVGSLLFAYVAGRAGSFALNCFRITLAMLVLWMALVVTGLVRGVPPPGDPSVGWLALSGVIGLSIGDLGYFGALQRLGARVATLLYALSPPMAALLAWVFLEESVGPIGLLGMALTLAGVLWVVLGRPAQEVPAGHRVQGVALGIMGAACQAIGLTLARHGMGDRIDPLVATALRMTAAAAATWLAALALRRLDAPMLVWRDPRTRLAALGATLLGPLLGVWLSLVALQHAGTAVAATLTATTPILILPLVVIVKKEKVGPRALLGAVLAVVGVALLFLRHG
jgi:drug/metabolite transporter (DMT)-like permease